ncbi:hypothetical protein Esi_0285_0028 [Ectocarpus siliculosus]|uniref:Uncharacterized protein n=1 Tax=Ectocarpus siliculosus TaxID=2880 RepID=D7FV11_ECTSI|nr:hypothetical protein Esi_0285_0028 [Ectocarpus siliculosus]|eukprot:CBJ31817.1 hypothetical protein Esi_0285_0028 [Ectocarpus siliculosus]
MPKRGRESLRNRWSVLEERLAVRTSSKCPPTTSSLMPTADRRARERCEDGKHAGSSQAQPTGAQQGAGGANPLSVMRALSLWPPYATTGNPGQLAALSRQFAAAAAAAAAVGAAPKAPVTFPSVATGNRKPDNPAFGGSAGVLGQLAAAAAAAGRGHTGRAATAAAATRPRGQQARKRRMLGSSHPDGQWASGAYQGEAVPPGDEDEDEDEARHRGSAVANSSSENRIGSLPAHGETGTGAAPGVPDRAAYAEDELSDDPDGSNNSDVEVANQGAAASGCVQAVNDRHEEESGAATGSVSSRITREAPRYEEDELSDDDLDESDSL